MDRRLLAGVALVTLAFILVMASVMMGSREVVHEQDFTIKDRRTDVGDVTLPPGDYELWWDNRDEERPEASYVWFVMYADGRAISDEESDSPGEERFMIFNGEEYELYSTFSLEQEEDISMVGEVRDDLFYRRDGHLVFIRKDKGNLPLAFLGMSFLVIGTLVISIVLMQTHERGAIIDPSDPARRCPPQSPLDDGTSPSLPNSPIR